MVILNFRVRVRVNFRDRVRVVSINIRIGKVFVRARIRVSGRFIVRIRGMVKSSVNNGLGFVLGLELRLN